MSYRVKSQAVIYEYLEDEIVLANLETGIYYSIRFTGVPIWMGLMAKEELKTIVFSASEKYQKDCKEQIEAFVRHLIEEDLLTEGESQAGFDFQWPEQWSDPCLEKYEEMKNLLALDPIHEVDELGWPSKSSL